MDRGGLTKKTDWGEVKEQSSQRKRQRQRLGGRYVSRMLNEPQGRQDGLK